MFDPQRLLELIEECVVEHGGDLDGWTLLADGSLRLFDGCVTLDVEPHEPPGRLPAVHAHVLARLHDHDDETLEACVVGFADDPEASLRQAAVLWTTTVAGPIRSFLDGKTACNAVATGDAPGEDFGFEGRRAFVGPVVHRFLDADRFHDVLGGDRPWFRFAAQAAAPKRIHLAKASIVAKGKAGWDREVEIDGHDAAHHDPDWPAGVPAPDVGYLTRFAVFELTPEEVARRAELDRAISTYAAEHHEHESIDALLDAMIAKGFDPDVVHEVETVSTIAFGRVYFQGCGFPYPPTVVRARRDGRIEPDVPLLSIPAHARAWALAPRLRETLRDADFQALTLHSAESQAIMRAIEAGGKLPDPDAMRMFPCIVPDRDVDDATMTAALATLKTAIKRARARDKPWWKFW